MLPRVPGSPYARPSAPSAIVDGATMAQPSVHVQSTCGLEGTELDAWRRFLRAHSAITRQLDADLIASHDLTLNDYEVLLHLSQAEHRRLRMSELADRVLLTRSGVTRLVDGLVRSGWVERVSCPSDARGSFAAVT